MRDVESVSWRCLAGVYAYGTAHPGTTASATLRLTSRMLGRPHVTVQPTSHGHMVTTIQYPVLSKNSPIA